MKASRTYEVIVTRGGRGPARRLDPTRVDQVEVLDIDSGEVVLFWDVLPAHTGRFARMLRHDLSRLDADEFVRTWSRYEVPS